MSLLYYFLYPELFVVVMTLLNFGFLLGVTVSMATLVEWFLCFNFGLLLVLSVMDDAFEVLDLASSGEGFACLGWLWSSYFLPAFGVWIGGGCLVISTGAYIIHYLIFLPVQYNYRLRRRKGPPFSCPNISGKRRSLLLRSFYRYRYTGVMYKDLYPYLLREHKRFTREHLEKQQQIAAARAEELDTIKFLDGKPDPGDDYRFSLNEFDPAKTAEFVEEYVQDPTYLVRLQNQLRLTNQKEHRRDLKKLIARLNLLMKEVPTAGSPRAMEAKSGAPTPTTAQSGKTTNERNTFAFHETAAILDTGASFGLTPFRSDFITYEKVNITVKDVSGSNKVQGFGLVLYKAVATNGEVVYLPGLAYHLKSTDIRLISPQAFHQLWGGHSVINDESFRLHTTSGQVLDVPLESKSNLPMLYGVTCSVQEHRAVGAAYARQWKVKQRLSHSFFFGNEDGGWRFTRLEDEDFAEPQEVTYDFDLCAHLTRTAPCITIADNPNLSPAQKELLLWHYKLGCSMKKIQYLMTGHSRKLAGGKSAYYPPVIAPKWESARNCPIPVCATNEVARAQVRKPHSRRQSAVKSNEKALSRDKYSPGDFVSMDTVTVPIKGRLFSGYGADSAEGYSCVTIFHDAGSGLIKVYPQTSATSAETLISKLKFEAYLWQQAGKRVKKYHSDGGVFTSASFRNDCEKKDQKQSFSGVGAKFQNGAAERSVQTLFWMCRTFLLHVAMRWSTHNADSPSLWPQALAYAEFLFNRTPSMSHGFSPLEILTNVVSDHRDLLRAHVFGAPTYVLDAALQDGKKLPKFSRRARVGQFLGFSPDHSTQVGLVRHLDSNYISPQYHCVYDDKFETVSGLVGDSAEDLADTIQQKWGSLFESDEHDLYIYPEFVDGELSYTPPPLDLPWLTEEEAREREDRLQEQVARGKELRLKSEEVFKSPVTVPDRKVTINEHPTAIDSSIEQEGEVGAVDVDDSACVDYSDVDESTQEENEISDQKETDVLDDSVSTWKDRLRRNRKSTSWKRTALVTAATLHSVLAFGPTQVAQLSDSEQKLLKRSSRPDMAAFCNQFSCSLNTQPPVDAVSYSRKNGMPRYTKKQKALMLEEIEERSLRAMTTTFDNIEELMGSPLSQHIQLSANDCSYDGSISGVLCEHVSPWFLNAKTGISAEDNPGWDEAMRGPEAEQYWEAAKSEIATLESMGSWEVVDVSEVPKGQRILPSLWVFKRKRLPDGTIRKYKGRFTVRGDRQVAGVDYNETWAPVCKWTTVRMMFILQCQLGLKSAAADVQAAFLHGTLPENERAYVAMPKGFEQPGKVLKLKQSVYGLKQAPRCFWKYLTEKMQDVGLEQSKFDSCLFIGKKVIAVAYVDDILFWAKDDADITSVMVQLRESGLLLEKESDAAGFLGVDIQVLEKDADGRATKLELTQTGLIDRIITNLGLDGGPEGNKSVPAGTKPLPKDADGDPCIEHFNVAAVVGQLLYLSGHTRPEIAYAVNCCARYMFCPKRSHELALKQIGRYLRKTRNKGLILEPTANVLEINAYPDADFAGMYGVERADDPACVKSRTGFVIAVANYPVLWKSSLQTKTALSTMEAEISALAHYCRELFPAIMDLASHLAEYYELDSATTKMNVTVHVDNISALIFAKLIPPEYIYIPTILKTVLLYRFAVGLRTRRH